MSRTPKSEWVVEALELHESSLLRYARWFVGDLESAREVVQETFLRLCREIRCVEGYLAQWLFTVCRNLAFDARKKAESNDILETPEIAVAPGLENNRRASAFGRILQPSKPFRKST